MGDFLIKNGVHINHKNIHHNIKRLQKYIKMIIFI